MWENVKNVLTDKIWALGLPAYNATDNDQDDLTVPCKKSNMNFLTSLRLLLRRLCWYLSEHLSVRFTTTLAGPDGSDGSDTCGTTMKPNTTQKMSRLRKKSCLRKTKYDATPDPK